MHPPLKLEAREKESTPSRHPTVVRLPRSCPRPPLAGMARHAQIRGDLRDAIDMVAELNRDMVEADLRQLVPDVDRLARAAAQVDCKVVQQGQELARVGACQSDEQLMELADAMREPLPAHSDREIEANQLWRNYATEVRARPCGHFPGGAGSRVALGGQRGAKLTRIPPDQRRGRGGGCGGCGRGCGSQVPHSAILHAGRRAGVRVGRLHAACAGQRLTLCPAPRAAPSAATRFRGRAL